MSMHIKDLFKDEVSSSAFKVIDGERRIVGKWGQISIIGDMFDVWLVQPDLSPLTMRRINSIEKKLQLEGTLVKLTGEAYFQTRDLELVRKTLPLLGIKKKRKLSPETIRKNVIRLKEAKNTQKKTPTVQVGENKYIIEPAKEHKNYGTTR